ncbi:MAG TPA: type II toxin-antitoxin system HicB family antitoxin [Chthonomonadaceae bacterium]|nr:type II toxin-antitoxin system HicB family antitoxin [Chthonomonadaceae bacterium]
MKEYTVIFERGKTGEENWGAYVPDLPGCVSTGDTLEEVKAHIEAAIRGHIAALQQTGQTVPEPTTVATTVQVAA